MNETNTKPPTREEAQEYLTLALAENLTMGDAFAPSNAYAVFSVFAGTEEVAEKMLAEIGLYTTSERVLSRVSDIMGYAVPATDSDSFPPFVRFAQALLQYRIYAIEVEQRQMEDIVNHIYRLKDNA